MSAMGDILIEFLDHEHNQVTNMIREEKAPTRESQADRGWISLVLVHLTYLALISHLFRTHRVENSPTLRTAKVQRL